MKYTVRERRCANRDIHANAIEHAFSLLNEFSYRFNRRDEQEQLFAGMLKNLLRTKALPYETLTAHV